MTDRPVTHASFTLERTYPSWREQGTGGQQNALAALLAGDRT